MTSPDTDRPHPRELERMYVALLEFYKPAQVDAWLTAPHKLLSGESPHKLMCQGRTKEVWALIDQLQSGAHV